MRTYLILRMLVPNLHIDDNCYFAGESDGEVQPKESKSSSAAKDVAFLQARLQDLMGKLKLLKKEKEAAEANANNARQRQLERYCLFRLDARIVHSTICIANKSVRLNWTF